MENKQFKFWNFEKRCHEYSSEILQLSATEIMDAKNCEWKIYYKHTQEIKIKKNPWLIMGSCFHSVIENDLRYFVKRGVHCKWWDIEIYFNAIWEKEKQNVDFSKLNEEKAKIKAKNYIQIFYQKGLNFIFPLNQTVIEKFICIPVLYQNKKLNITGKIDCITKDLWINDWKTAQSFDKYEKLEDDIQSQLYSYVFKQLGYDIRGFRFVVCSGIEVKNFNVEYSESKVCNILKYAFELKDRLENPESLMRAKNINECKWCSWVDICSQCLIQKVLTIKGKYDI